LLERNVTLLTGDKRLLDGKLTLFGGATLEFLAGDGGFGG
jgi:hypothetical protein